MRSARLPGYCLCAVLAAAVGAASDIVCPPDVGSTNNAWYAGLANSHGSTAVAAKGWSFDEALVAYETSGMEASLCGGVLLDVGCGNGQYSKLLSELHGARAVVGVDPEFVLVRAARKVLSGTLSGTKVCQGSATDLAFIPTNTADAFVSIFPINYLSKAEAIAALREALRVTKPGARILFGCSQAVAPPWGNQTTHSTEWWVGVAKALGIAAPEFRPSSERRGHQPHRFDVHIVNLPATGDASAYKQAIEDYSILAAISTEPEKHSRSVARRAAAASALSVLIPCVLLLLAAKQKKWTLFNTMAAASNRRRLLVARCQCVWKGFLLSLPRGRYLPLRCCRWLGVVALLVGVGVAGRILLVRVSRSRAEYRAEAKLPNRATTSCSANATGVGVLPGSLDCYHVGKFHKPVRAHRRPLGRERRELL